MLSAKLADALYVLAAMVVCVSAGAMAFLGLYFCGIIGGPIIDKIVYSALDWTTRLVF
jgi:hypothetical protein